MSAIENLGETSVTENIQGISLKQNDDNDIMNSEGILNIESDTLTKKEGESDKTEISTANVPAAPKQLPLKVIEHFITTNEQNPQIPEIESEIADKICGDSKITPSKTNEGDIANMASEETRVCVEHEIDEIKDNSIQKQQESDTKQLSNDVTNEIEHFEGTGNCKIDDNISINIRKASEITTLDVSSNDIANKDNINIEITHVNKDKSSHINEESTNVLNEVSVETNICKEPNVNMEQNDNDDDFALKCESVVADDSLSNVTLKLESGNNQASEKCVGESMNIDTHNDNLMIKIKVNDIICNVVTNIVDDSNNDEKSSKSFRNNSEIPILNESDSDMPILSKAVIENKNIDTISTNTIRNSSNETNDSTTECNKEIFQTEINDDINSPKKVDHKLDEPEVMLKIPSQKLIDTEDVNLTVNSDHSVSSFYNNNINSIQYNNNIKEMSTDEMLKDDAKTDKDLGETVSGKEISTNTMSNELETPEIQPSTSSAPDVCDKMTPDTSDEVPDVSDSLGLLAESSRVMEDDEDQDDDDEGDEDDDFDQDECSNQMTTGEHSENSSAQHSETEANIEQDEKEIESPAVESENAEFEFNISNIEGQVKTGLTEPEDKDVEIKANSIEENIEMEASNDVQVTEDVTEEEKIVDDFEEEPVEMEAANDVQVNEDVPVEEEEKTLDDFNEESTEIKASNDVQVTEDITVEEEITLDGFVEQSSEVDDQGDIETVKLSDTSDNEGDVEIAIRSDQSAPKSPKINDKEVEATPVDQTKLSPSKIKKLGVSQAAPPVLNIVDLEESSSEDEAREVIQTESEVEAAVSAAAGGVTSVNLPTDIDVMCTSAGSTSEILTKQGELVISGVPKPPPVKRARLNTSEVSIKTTSVTTEPTLVIPEAKVCDGDARPKPKMCLEIFNLDSDEEETTPPVKEQEISTPVAPQSSQKRTDTAKCLNRACGSGAKGPFLVADAATQMHYDMARKKRSMVCQDCAQAVMDRKQDLIKGIKDFCPLMDLGEDKLCQDLVEISDSESEDEAEELKIPPEIIGEKGAKLLEENLAEIMNETWRKFKMDARLKETTDTLNMQIQELENESKEIDQMLNECQIATDKLRNDLYASYEQKYAHVPSIIIYDTPQLKYQVQEEDGASVLAESSHPAPTRQSKRRLAAVLESPAKRPAIPLGYAPLEGDSTQKNVEENKATPPPAVDVIADDDKEVSVVKLSAEAAPADLPPPGDLDLSRPPLKVGMCVYAMRNAFGPWLKGRLLECQPKTTSQFTVCRVRFDHKVKSPCKILSARCLAYPDPAGVRMTIGTRIIALFKCASNEKRESFYSGVVAEMPNPVNNYRYLVFFDDGYAQYVPHCHTRLVCESSTLVWEEVHPFSRQFVRDYLQAYPERPMVRLHEGQKLETEWNGKWCPSRVIRVDASLAEVLFSDDGRKEWIYRGSTRLAPLFLELQAAERHRQRPMPRSKAQTRTNMPYVEYIRSDEPSNEKPPGTDAQHQQTDEIRQQRAVAKKSTAINPPSAPAQQPPPSTDSVTSRVVYYTPKNAVKPYKMVPHTCSLKCKRSDVLSLKELRTYNPLAKPLLSGWERQIVRSKGLKKVMYRAPCGRRLRDLRELHRYLRITQSELPVDLFDFYHGTHCLAEFVLNKCRVGKKDLSHGKENVPVPCVNYYDDSLPEFCSYNTERTPTAGVPLNLDPEFLCGCDCTDDCQNKSKCACWKMTLEGARTIGLDGSNVGYVYKRLPEPLPSGIYECNSRCKCKQTCLNRVAQHPLQLKLQVFKTLNRGWGIRALNDIPKGAFLCVYAGNLLTDATANLDGLNEGDEYLAELDYIEVVEQMKEGYEEDIPASDKKLDKKELGKKNDSDNDEDEEDAPSSDEEESGSKTDKDLDFRPAYIGLGLAEFNKALRKRDKAKKEKNAKKEEEEKAKMKEAKEVKEDDDCITISDDEEVREPSRFSAQTGMGANAFISKYRSVRTHFGRDEACYIMDAKVQGNIGRYLNHSCSPNVFVQNVFVDTHDPRFPWVAFFALSHIKAGTELTWNYNYDVGSVPGKVLYCYCGAPNCRGRLL